MSLLLALDLGTSSTRTALFDETGSRLVHTTGQESYPLLTDGSGAAELDAMTLKAAFIASLAKTMEQYRADPSLAGQKIAAVGISCFWHGLLGTDAAGRPITPVITWADARPAAAAEELRRELSEKKIHARTGCMLRASFWPAKLRWLRKNNNALYRKVARWMSPAEWLQLQVCDGANCALGMATATGLLNPTTLRWDPQLLEMSGIAPAQLQPLSDDPVKTGADLARKYPELAHTAWYPGIGDGATSNLGSGATKPGLAAINVGTSAALRIMRSGKKAAAPFGLFAYRVDAERYLVGGAVSNAGNLRAWCLRELKLEADPLRLEEELAARPRPEHGLVVLPFWTVERAPTWNESVPGMVTGLKQATTSLDLLQAITEATYHRIARVADLLLEEEAVPKFLVSGGIQHSPSAMQRLADVLGRPIYANPEPEASLRGAAIYAMEKLGWAIPPLKLGRAIRPRRDIAALYAVERQKQIDLEASFTKATAVSH